MNFARFCRRRIIIVALAALPIGIFILTAVCGPFTQGIIFHIAG
jgi:hypothetical protein